MDKRVWIGYCAGTVNSYCKFKHFEHDLNLLKIDLSNFRSITGAVISRTRFDEEDIMELSAMVLERMQPHIYKWDKDFRVLRCEWEDSDFG